MVSYFGLWAEVSSRTFVSETGSCFDRHTLLSQKLHDQNSIGVPSPNSSLIEVRFEDPQLLHVATAVTLSFRLRYLSCRWTEKDIARLGYFVRFEGLVRFFSIGGKMLAYVAGT